MKKVFSKVVVLSILVMMGAVACKKHGNYNHGTPAAGPAGPSLTGNLEGVLFLYDDGGNKILSAAALTGDTILLTNNSSGTVLTTTTSSTGTYTFTGITTGTYSMTVMKQGYGTVKAYGIEFAGGGTAYKNFSLAQIPTTNVVFATTFTSTSTSAGNLVNLNITVPASAEKTSVIMYVSSSATVNGIIGNYLTSYTTSTPSSNTAPTFTYGINNNTLNQLGLPSGSTVYFAVYIYGSTGSSYTDDLSGLPVYTALSSTPVISSCIVP